MAEDLAILVTGNITSTAGLKTITTQDSNGRGRHNIMIVAGAKLVPSAGTGLGTVPGAPAIATVTLDPTAVGEIEGGEAVDTHRAWPERRKELAGLVEDYLLGHAPPSIHRRR